MDAQIVGERIAKLRKTYNMTQKQLADKLSVTDKAVSKWETGAGLPDISMLPALASALNVSVDEIVSGSSNDENKKDSHNNQSSRITTVRRYIRKPIVMIMSSFILALIALVIIFSNLKANEGSEYDEGIHTHLDASSGFGVTADRAKKIYDMQVAEDIKTQLLQHYHIDDVVVLIDTAVVSPFRLHENDSETSVSVILSIADNYTLSDTDVQTIKNLIRGAVPGVKDENISIT